MLSIAITGGIAEGKSTVLEMFREAGHSVGSADEVAREVRERDDVQRELARMAELATPIDVSMFREALSRSVDLRREVNAYLHPLVLGEMVARDRQIWEVPLLIETVLIDKFFRTIVVTCGREVQRERLVSRLGDSDLADRLLGSQLATRAKVPFADFVVRTDCPIGHVLNHVAELSHGFGIR